MVSPSSIPNGVKYYAPVELVYTYSSTNVLPSVYQQMLFFPYKQYSSTLGKYFANMVFFDINGNYINSWLENIGGIATGGTTALYWLKMNAFTSNSTSFYSTTVTTTYQQSNLITSSPIYTYTTTFLHSVSTTIFVGMFAKNSFNYSSTGSTGMNYLIDLSLSGVDNGAQVFNFYNNFTAKTTTNQIYGRFVNNTISSTWLPMFIYKPTFPPNGGIIITSLGGWQGYVTGYQTHVPEVLETYFYSGYNQYACIGIVKHRHGGLNLQPVDLASVVDNIPVGNYAPKAISSDQNAYIQFQYRQGDYFGQWGIASSMLGSGGWMNGGVVLGGYARENTNYVISGFVGTTTCKMECNYGNVNMVSQSTRITTGVPYLEADIPGFSGWFDFGTYTQSSAQFFWIRTREYLLEMPKATFGQLQVNTTPTVYKLTAQTSLGVNST